MVLIMRIQARYSDIKTDTAAEFTSASSSVKSGLVASGVVSAWTWAGEGALATVRHFGHTVNSYAYHQLRS